MGVCTTRQWQTSGRLVQELKVCTAHVGVPLYLLQTLTCDRYFDTSISKKKRRVWLSFHLDYLSKSCLLYYHGNWSLDSSRLKKSKVQFRNDWCGPSCGIAMETLEWWRHGARQSGQTHDKSVRQCVVKSISIPILQGCWQIGSDRLTSTSQDSSRMLIVIRLPVKIPLMCDRSLTIMLLVPNLANTK